MWNILPSIFLLALSNLVPDAFPFSVVLSLLQLQHLCLVNHKSGVPVRERFMCKHTHTFYCHTVTRNNSLFLLLTSDYNLFVFSITAKIISRIGEAVLLFWREKASVGSDALWRWRVYSASRFVFQISWERDIGTQIVQFQENILS